MVDGGILDKNAFLTHRYPLTEITSAFSEIARGDVVKAVVAFS
jgi:Zn-dependent alcohol dehydrogenase